MVLSPDELEARVRGLPVLPRVVLELRAALADDTATTERIVGLVGTEPALATATLRLANSSFYGASGRIGTLADAVRLLGLHTLGAVVTSAAVFGAFDGLRCPGFDLGASQRHALATAIASRLVAEEREQDAELAFTAGLVHDIGRLALAAVCPERLAAVIAEVASLDALPVEIERERLGTDHAAVGAILASHWRLPAAVVDTIARHHETVRPQAEPLADAVHLADAVTYALGHSGLADEPVPPIAPEACHRLGITPAAFDPLFARIAARLRPGIGAAAAA